MSTDENMRGSTMTAYGVTLDEALVRLFNASTCPFPPARPATLEEAQQWLDDTGPGRLDYIRAQCMKVCPQELVDGGPYTFALYDRDNGAGRGEAAVRGGL